MRTALDLARSVLVVVGALSWAANAQAEPNEPAADATHAEEDRPTQRKVEPPSFVGRLGGGGLFAAGVASVFAGWVIKGGEGNTRFVVVGSSAELAGYALGALGAVVFFLNTKSETKVTSSTPAVAVASVREPTWMTTLHGREVPMPTTSTLINLTF